MLVLCSRRLVPSETHHEALAGGEGADHVDRRDVVPLVSRPAQHQPDDGASKAELAGDGGAGSALAA